MSNDLATQSVTEFAPVKWTAKTSKGKVVKQAYCETSVAFAPKIVRVAEAQQRDLQSLLNGRYVNVLRAVASKMSAKEKVRLFEAGVSVNRDKPTKADMVPFADAVVQMWAPAKGEKAAIAAMLKVFTETVTKAITAPISGADKSAELAKYVEGRKAQFEQGLISQEEFEACTM